jgi:large subunit ribosomal protein L25
MSDRLEFKFNATPRTEMGKAATRRLRHANKVPAIIYGANKAATAVTLEHKEISKAFSHEAVFSQILTVNVDKKKEKVVLKAVERHHTKPQVMHIDFLRIKAGEKLTMQVPFHFLGEEESPGIKEGGIVSHVMNEVEIKCLPEDLPQYIDVDISKLGIEESVHLADIILPKGAELTIELDEEHNPGVVSINRPRIEEEPEAVAEEEAAEGEAPTEEKAEDKEPLDKKSEE